MKKSLFERPEVICSICKNLNKPITLGEFQAEEVCHTADGLAHADCYWGELGKVIDEHPIASGRVRRG